MSNAVSVAELAQIQADAAAMVCDKPCTIWRDLTATTSASADMYGSSTSSRSNTVNYSQIAATMCGLGEPSATHLANYDFEIASEESVLVHLPIGTNAQTRDHVVVEGQTIELHVILSPRSYPALLEFIGAEIK